MSARSPISIGSSRGSVTRDREISLDPADARGWEELRTLGHRMVDDMLEYLRTARERPVWRPVPADVRARLSGPAPREPTPAETVYEEFKRDVLRSEERRVGKECRSRWLVGTSEQNVNHITD